MTAELPSVPYRLLDPDGIEPVRMRPGDAAIDLPAAASADLAPGARALVPTGIAVAIPDGHAGLVLSRSGLALRHGVAVLNAPGLIDPGYRGEVGIVLVNLGAEPVRIERGDRIAQLLVVAVGVAGLTRVDDLPAAPDDRGAAGFGSSG